MLKGGGKDEIKVSLPGIVHTLGGKEASYCSDTLKGSAYDGSCMTELPFLMPSRQYLRQ